MYIPEEEEIHREKAKARQLRASQWWKRKCAKGVCHWCGKTVAPGDLTMDHVLPLARGGKTTKNNVVPCCKECNTRKKSRMPVQWDTP
ncbi:MAG: HNH endonuclease [Desulfosalsimonas sp.]|uniref:HNH endonuclease n=1 Tax=Desulfosalsimonas sp. TaxID=3073848 RepID=UPI003970E430